MPAANLIGQTIGGTYLVERLIGEGGMGAVYAARHLRLPTLVAIKTLHIEGGANPDVQARFRREAEITSTLRHPNIVQVTDFNVLEDGTPYLVMELLEGEDLSARLERVGKLSVPEVLTLVRAVGAGLATAHARNVVHRDLKPQNIFLARQGDGSEVPKIVDFGISKIQHGAESMAMRTRDNMLIGTPNYMSPEQARGENSIVDGRTDQWALAAIAYQCLTGKVAFAGNSLAEVVYQVVMAEPAAVRELAPEVPDGTAQALRRALSKSRDERFPSIVDFVQSLDRELGPAPPPPVRVADGGRSPLPRLAIMGVIAVVVLGTIAAVAVPLIKKGHVTTGGTTTTTTTTTGTRPVCHGLAECQSACDANDGTGCTNLGMLYDRGEGVAKDQSRAVALFQKACDLGSAAGCNNLGASYAHAKDYVRAVALYRQACDAGEGRGCANLGACYQAGTGVGKDPVRAVALYQQACDGGDMMSCSNLGQAYINGVGVQKDAARAATLFDKACQAGDGEACSNLAICYHSGAGVAKDDARAIKLLEKTCTAEPALACARLGTFYWNGYGVPKDEARGVKLWEQACNAGDDSACADVAIKIYKGEHIAKDLPRAFSLFERACDAGSGSGCTNLGVMYMRGETVARDEGKAIRLFQQSCDAGDELGCSNLEVMRRQGGHQSRR
jgi:TPR repeat protein